MNLEIQIQSIAISIFFGLFTSLTFNSIYCFIFKTKKKIRLLITIGYIFLNLTLYFILLMCINNGVIHNYFLFSLLIGFFIGNKKTKKLRYKFNSYNNEV